MINLKVFLAICLITPCILASSFEYDSGHIDKASFEDHSKEHVVVISSDSEEHHEYCAAPNGLGLKNLLRQINKLLPKQEIKQIVKSYAKDPQIKALRSALKSRQIQKKVRALKHSKEYQVLKDYICRVLHLDIHSYHNLAKSLITHSIKRSSDVRELNGIKGFINAIDAVLPHQKIRDLYQSLLKTDEELVKAVEHLKSEEFHKLVMNVKNNVPAHKELRNELIALGIPVDDIRDVIADTLGWSQNLDVLF